MINKLKELNNKIIWESHIESLYDVIHTTNENDIWKAVGKFRYDKVFPTEEMYFKFLFDNYNKLDIRNFGSIIAQKFYNYCTDKLDDENIFFFFSKSFNVQFIFFEKMLEKYKFLLYDYKKVEDKDKVFFDDFWNALFKSNQEIPEVFIKKYYWHFYKNKTYFYYKVIRHNVFFKLEQGFINKFKSNFP